MAAIRVNLVRDCRLSSECLRNALVCGLKASGCQAADIGVAPTPLLYYSVFHLQAAAAVMITGSHNPPEYNGFKIVCGSSTIHGEEIQEIRRLIERRDFLTGAGSERSVDVVEPYVNEIAAQFHFARRIKVDIGAGNGTGGPVMHHLLENLNPLIAAVRQQGADLGIAFDGDTDRIGAVDEKGNVVYGNRRRDLYRRSEMLAVALRRHPQARRQRHHVADRPFADQGQNEGGARRTGQRDERPPLPAG